MNDPTSGWQTLDGDRASISYDTGFLAVRFNVTDSWAYSARDLGTTATTVVQAANLYPDSAGGFGMLCGMKSSGTFFGARVSTDGSLAFIKVDNGTESILENKNDLNLDVTLNDSNPFALECSTSVDGVVSMIVGLSHTGPVAVYREPGGPIDGFDVTAIYAESANDAYVLGADTAAVWAAAPNGQMSDGAQALFAHIPTDLQTGCYESPIWNSEATYEVTCLEQVKGKGAEILQYQQYDDDTGMTAAYQDLVTAFGPQPDSGSCDSGPASFEWNRTGDSANSGSVQCAPQTVGIRIDWSDHLTFILSALIDLQGSYSDTYEQWRNGGPIIPQG